MAILTRINQKLVPSSRLAAAQKSHAALEDKHYQQLVRILIKTGKLSELLHEDYVPSKRAFNNLKLPPEERQLAAWLNLQYLVMEDPPVFRSRIPPTWDFDRAGVVLVEENGKRTRYKYREDIQALVGQYWDKTEDLRETLPDLPESSLAKLKAIQDRFNIKVEGGFNVHQLATLEGFLSSMHPDDLEQVKLLRKINGYGLGLMAYDHASHQMEVYEATLNELGLEYNDTTLYRMARLSMYHEFGHTRFDQLTSATYREFLAINGYRRDLLGDLKKLALWFTWGITFMRDAREMVKHDGFYLTLRLCSRFLDSMTMETDKDISGYTTDYGRTNLMEDFAEQFAYHRGLPNVYKKYAAQSGLIRANREFFRKHFPNERPGLGVDRGRRLDYLTGP